MFVAEKVLLLLVISLTDNYADDNSISHTAPVIEEVCSALQHDDNIVVGWFESNWMQADSMQ